ncbi:unnamed protein product [Plutella xylostella]|uniref:(diamondback moth) hypothetical protein n=1 Tax=Plutella xylostella TaxID=51655 RepID=A0A8S4G0P5_PLUXY|nr:unnamed protein product [Plutella xylostella]
MTSSDGDSQTLQKQQARAKLRELFLRGIKELTGEPCNILTYEKSSLTATFASWKPDGSEILVRDVTTPAAVQLDSALLRAPDVIAVEFVTPVLLP